MIWKKLHYRIRNHFGFSHTETKGFMLLVLLMGLLITVPFVLPHWLLFDPASYSDDQTKLDSLVAALELKSREDKKPFFRKPARPQELFAFDPNVISGPEWNRLGAPEYLAQRIIKYRTKGGKFRIKADVKKIYGFPPTLYAQLEPYILLPVVKGPTSYSSSPFANSKEKAYPPRTSATHEDWRPTAFDLNAADTVQLKKVRGIGPALSKRIIKYRERLGGFVALDQLKEVYGLDSVVVQELLKYASLRGNSGVRIIQINVATAEELKQHPYLSPRIATLIVAYRQQHGNFHSIDELGKIKIVDAATLRKIQPYLAF